MPRLAGLPRALAGIGLALAAAFAHGADNAGQTGRFVVHRLAQHLYALGEPGYYQKNYSYLFIGKDRALMFDAGANQGEEIIQVIGQLTDKPVSVLPSHLHFDHLGGLPHFSSIYLPDLPFTRSLQRSDGLYQVPEAVHLGQFDNLVLPPFKVERLIQPGQVIDLGGLQLRMLSVPGHTRDEVMLYDQNHDILLTGDHLYPSWLLVGNLDDYLASLDATLQSIDQDTVLYGAHAGDDPNRVPRMDRDEVVKIRDAMQRIRAGQDPGQAFADPELIRRAKLHEVDKGVSILTGIQFTDGREFGY
ncbi:MBL fold metallo-hydrolase [Pseudomonas sessilinigenes]|uniref:MBL fold metallo-hydrolase n=1 Tax=Pseudomonas sessilinigenes TaxID=658629 RepID=A0ABX8MH36_9PSED|nr:MBL fold metallo-hydrolase [Pseudomonas sessilinigenes]AZC24763.1 beta-lactamase-like [Pseudomonas sessilinigenes]QXH37817.1 MBL fold metallo-hydrolase [Pseudomonas sessilinigenes]